MSSLPRMKRGPLRGRRGMTLIEMLVALLVIGVLATMLLDAFQSAENESHDNTARTQLVAGYEVAQISYREQGRFVDGDELADLLNEAEPSLDFTTSPGALTGDSRQIYVQNAPSTPPAQVTMCVMSSTGKVFCLRGHNAKGLVLSRPGTAANELRYGTSGRSRGESVAEALAALPIEGATSCVEDCNAAGVSGDGSGQRGWESDEVSYTNGDVGGDEGSLAPRFVAVGPTIEGWCTEPEICGLGIDTEPGAGEALYEINGDSAIHPSIQFRWAFSADPRRTPGAGLPTGLGDPPVVECYLDGVDKTIELCASDNGSDDLAGTTRVDVPGQEGMHVFRVVVRNATGETEKSFTWRYDRTASTIDIISAPTVNRGEVVTTTAATFLWKVRGAAPDTMLCSVDTVINGQADVAGVDCLNNDGTISYANVGYKHREFCVTATKLHLAEPIKDCWNWYVHDDVQPNISAPWVTESSSALYVPTANTVCYNPRTAAGSMFAVAVNATDAGVGMASVTFPSVTGLGGTGAVNGPSTKTSPVSGSTYSSNYGTTTLYTFGASPTASGPFAITAADAAANSSPAQVANTRTSDLIFTPDNSHPPNPRIYTSDMTSAFWANVPSRTLTLVAPPAAVGCGGDTVHEYRLQTNNGVWGAATVVPSSGQITITVEARVEIQVRARDHVYIGPWRTAYELESDSTALTPLAMYKFEASPGVVVDTSGNNHTLTGSASNPASLDFVGESPSNIATSYTGSQRLDTVIPAIDNAPGGYNTYSFWHYLTGNGGIIAALGNVQLYRYGDALGLHTCPGIRPDLYGGIGFNAIQNRWMHITVVVHNNPTSTAAGVGTGSRLYINGVSQAMADRTGHAPCASVSDGPSNAAGDRLMIGNNQWASAPTGGYTDNFVLYAGALTQTEVSRINSLGRVISLIDRTAPHLTSVSGHNAPYWARTSVVVYASAADANPGGHSGVSHIMWQAANAWVSSGNIGNGGGVQHSGAELCGTGCVQGLVNWRFAPCDRAGNCAGWSGYYGTKMDTIPPTQSKSLIWGAGNSNGTDAGYGILTMHGSIGWYANFYDNTSGSGVANAYYLGCHDWAYNVWDGGASYPCGSWVHWLSWAQETNYGSSHSWSWAYNAAGVQTHVCWHVYDAAGNMNEECADQGTGYWYGDLQYGSEGFGPNACVYNPYWEWYVSSGCLIGSAYQGWGGMHGGWSIRWWGTGGHLWHVGAVNSGNPMCWTDSWSHGFAHSEWAVSGSTRYYIRFPYAPGAALSRMQSGWVMHWTPDVAAGDNGYPADHPNSDYYARCHELWSWSRHVGSAADRYGRYVWVRNDNYLPDSLVSYGSSGNCGVNTNSCRKQWGSRINAYANSNNAMDYDDFWGDLW